MPANSGRSVAESIADDHKNSVPRKLRDHSKVICAIVPDASLDCCNRFRTRLDGVRPTASRPDRGRSSFRHLFSLNKALCILPVFLIGEKLGKITVRTKVFKSRCRQVANVASFFSPQ